MFSHSRPLVLVVASLAATLSAGAQSLPTATVGLFPSVFAGVTATRTDLNAGTNVSITGGLDLGLYAGKRLEYSLEYRGIYPVVKGDIDSQKSNLVGLHISRRNGRLHPYADIFFGRGEIDYAGAGAQLPGKPIFYTQSSSNVIAAGGGANVDLGPRLALRFDALLQRYNTPVATSGHLYPESGTIGLVYRFPPLGVAKGHRRIDGR